MFCLSVIAVRERVYSRPLWRLTRTAGALAVFSLLLFAATTARADSDWHASAGVGTDLPLAIGARAQVEMPFRLRLSTSIGILPAPYVDGINAFVVAVGGYDDATADLVKSTISSSLIWRNHVGYRPVKSLGLYGELGYGLVALGGSTTASTLIAGVTGKSFPSSEASGNHVFDAAATLHMLDLEVGWDFPIADRLELRVAAGGAFTVASQTTIEPRFSPRAARLVNEFTDYGEQYLDDTFTSYVFTPVLSVSAAYRFF